MTATADEEARRHLVLAGSHAPVERDAAVSWLLAHPERTEPLIAEAVAQGTASDPELYLRILAAIGSEQSIPAMESALLRGHEGETFYAAQALAAHPSPKAAATLRRHLDRLSDTVLRGLDQAGFDRSEPT